MNGRTRDILVATEFVFLSGGVELTQFKFVIKMQKQQNIRSPVENDFSDLFI